MIYSKYLMAVAMLALMGCSESAQLQKKAEQAVRERSRNPKSVEFRNVRSGNGVVCGEVNGENAMGGLTGFTPFSVSEHGIAIYDENADPKVFSTDNTLIDRHFKYDCPPK